MSPSIQVEITGSSCFPRVSGDEPQDVSGTFHARAFSPRERG